MWITQAHPAVADQLPRHPGVVIKVGPAGLTERRTPPLGQEALAAPAFVPDEEDPDDELDEELDEEDEESDEFDEPDFDESEEPDSDDLSEDDPPDTPEPERLSVR